MKKVFRYILRVLAVLVVLLLLLPFVLYIPFVQDFAKRKAEQFVAAKTDMRLAVGRIRLGFPLHLRLDRALMAHAGGDTLAYCGALRLDVAFWPLLHGQIDLQRLALSDVVADYADTVSQFGLKARLGSLILQADAVDLKRQTARVPLLKLADGDVSLSLGLSAPDTLPQNDTVPLRWRFDVERLQLSSIGFAMAMADPAMKLDVALDDGRLTGATVDLGLQDVVVDRVMLGGGRYSFLTDTASHAEAPETAPDSSGVTSAPWTVRVGQVRLRDNAAVYGSLWGEPKPGFDPSHIEVTGLNLTVDSVWNRGSEVSARIARLSLRERSGLEIRSLSGGVVMDSVRVALTGLHLETAASSVQADLTAGAGILRMEQDAPLDADLRVSLASSDLLLAFPVDDPVLRHAVAGKSLALDARVDGSLAQLYLRRVQLGMPGYIALLAQGNLQSVMSPDRLAGAVKLHGTFDRLGFLTSLLPDTALRHRLRIPDHLALDGQVQARGGALAPSVALTVGRQARPQLTLSGRFDPHRQAYAADLVCDSFPVRDFLPLDSLGLVTLSLKAGGTGFDPFAEAMQAEAGFALDRFDYKGYMYDSIRVDVSLADHDLQGRLTGLGRALDFDLGLTGRLTREQQQAALRGRIAMVDLYALHLSPDKVRAGLTLDVKASAADSGRYGLNAVFDSIRIEDRWHVHNIQRTAVTAETELRSVQAAVRSGDLALDFHAPVPVDTLAAGFSQVAVLAAGQIARGDLAMAEIGAGIPPFDLRVSAGLRNAVNDFLRVRDMAFGSLTVDATSKPGRPFSMKMLVNRLATQGMILDTVSAGVVQQNDRLSFYLRLADNDGTQQNNMALIALGGYVEGHEALLRFLQRNQARETGFNFGLRASLADSAVTVTMIPEHPILGFEPWTVNKDNYFTYRFDQEMFADIRLEAGWQRFHVGSVTLRDSGHNGVRLDIAGIDIGKTLALLPGAPQLGGVLDVDVSAALHGGLVDAEGQVGVRGLQYDGSRVGDLGLDLMYRMDTMLGQVVDLRMLVDRQEALTVRGNYHPGSEQELDMAVALPALPLAVANAFLPPDMGRLQGALKGHVAATGTPSALRLDGELQFDTTRFYVPMIGTGFDLSSERITIDSSRVHFNKFAITGPNRKPLTIDGTVDMSDFAAIVADLAVAATDFQVINVPRNRQSMVYGKANIDLGATARGPIDELVVRGHVNLLGGTEVNYVMRDSPLDVKEKPQNLVTFVSFADTADLLLPPRPPAVNIGGMDMLMNVDINPAVKMAVLLSEDGKNRIDLQGGGNLTYSMNPLGDTRFSGRYELTGGTVRYNPPVISQKNFKITSGSYVEWLGDIADPRLNITAVETVRTTVQTDEQNSRQVSFDITIVIRNTLEDLSIMFDLSAPQDLTIQNELSSLTAEQRSTQAMALLVYNTYTGPGTTAKANKNNPLNSFIEKELNQWAQNNLKGVDLSFGIDTYDEMTASGQSQRTDYSYKLSKSLFNDRVRAVIGGSFSSDADPTENLKENLVDDISLEYMLTKRDNMFIKVFRHTGYESILEGEVTETGVGFVVRKKMLKLGELFRLTRPKEVRELKKEKRAQRRAAKRQAAQPAVLVPETTSQSEDE